MSPSIPVRAACATQLKTLIKAHPLAAGAVVESAWPGDKGTRKDMIWFGEIVGGIEARLVVAGRRHVDDVFTIPVLIRVAGHKTIDECRTRLGELIGAVHDVVVETGSLEDAIDGVLSALPTAQAREDVRTTPTDGVLGFAVYPVEIHTRLT